MGRARSTGSKGARAATDAFQVALRLLAGRPKSRAALATQLAARGYPTSEVEAALTRCRQLDYLKEAEVVAAQARALLDAGHAPAAIVARLAAKGFPEKLVARTVAEVVRETGWTSSAAAQRLVAARKLTGVRAARFLLSRGFDEDVARRVAGFDEA